MFFRSFFRLNVFLGHLVVYESVAKPGTQLYPSLSNVHLKSMSFGSCSSLGLWSIGAFCQHQDFLRPETVHCKLPKERNTPHYKKPPSILNNEHIRESCTPKPSPKIIRITQTQTATTTHPPSLPLKTTDKSRQRKMLGHTLLNQKKILSLS